MMTHNEKTAATVEPFMMSYLIFSITDAVDDYEKTLAEAVKENRIQNIEVTVKHTRQRRNIWMLFMMKRNHTITFIKKW